MSDELKIMIEAKIDEIKSVLGIKKSLDDMGKNLTLPVTARLGKTKSRQQLKNDLSTMDNLSVSTSAKLNIPKSKSEIKKNLALIDIEKINITAELSRKSTQDKIKAALSGMDGSIKINADIKGSEQLNQLDEGMKRINRSSLATVASITLLHQSIRQFQRAAKDMIDTSISLDKQLTDLRLVTGGNYNEARNMVSAYNELARELHATTAQVMDASSKANLEM